MYHFSKRSRVRFFFFGRGQVIDFLAIKTCYFALSVSQPCQYNANMVPFFLSLLMLFRFSLFFYSHKRKSAFASANLPPGRIGWPVIGETLAFLSACREGLPEKFFFDRAADHAVFKTSLLGEPTTVLCGAAGNKFLFSNEDKLVTAWYPRSVVKLFPLSPSATTGTEAKKLRNLLPGLLKPEGLRRSVGVMDEAARRHFADEWGGREVFAAHLAKRYTFRVSARLFASLDDPDEIEKVEEPFATVAAGLFSLPIDLPGTALNRAMKAVKVVKKELMKAIKRRKVELAEGRAGTREDILSHLLVTCTDDGRYMSELDITDRIIALLVASYDTTSAVCTFVVKYLAELPHVYDAVYNGTLTSYVLKTFFFFFLLLISYMVIILTTYLAMHIYMYVHASIFMSSILYL